jgi:ribosomal protein S18 acetylase RimI-like enzyme
MSSLRTEKLQKKHATAFTEFFDGLDRRTTQDYTHFGYVPNGHKATSSVFKDLRHKKLAGYLLFHDLKVVGFGHLDFFPKREKGHVVKLGIVLHPGYQGKGFGKILLDYMIADAKQMGKEKIWLATYKDNPRAFELYRSRGFHVEGVFRREEKVGRKYRDVVSMALFLSGGRK